MKTVVIKSFEELNKLVFENCFDHKIGRYRDDYVYRGVGDSSYDLITKLQRVCDHNISLEKSIIRSFIKYGHLELSNTKSIFQKLALGQHYGLPTRLLDWSYSPLVAAHFATIDLEKYDTDGAIYAINLEEANKLIPKKLKDFLDKHKTQTFTVEDLDFHFKNLEELENLEKDPFFIFFEPVSQIERITNQYALFSMVSKADVTLSSLLPEDSNVFYKIIIPKEVKLEIRDKLDYINISERFIFPGLDGICSWITRRYSKIKK